MDSVHTTGMRTEINKKRGRSSERSEEARAKEAKRGKNSWGVVSPPPPQTGSRGAAPRGVWGGAISLQEMQDIPDR